MKNYSSKTAKTLAVDPGEDTPFIKIGDLFKDIRKFEKGDVPILGYIKVHSDKYDKDQYSLLVNYKGVMYFLNVPTWYGKALAEDFVQTGEPATEFFSDAYIKEIEVLDTKYNNKTYNIVIY